MVDFELARKTMVDNQLRTAGVTDRRILTAMGEIPREQFVTGSRQSLAYIDDTHRLGATRMLAAPAPFAKLVQLAGIGHTDRVPDVGAGNGYSTAVISKLAAEVTGIENDQDLVAAAKDNLAALKIHNARVVEGELTGAEAGQGPFDAIVIEGAVEEIPHEMFAQLAPEGRIVAMIQRGGDVPVAHLFVKSGDGIASRAEFDAKLPPLDANRVEQFVF